MGLKSKFASTILIIGIKMHILFAELIVDEIPYSNRPSVSSLAEQNLQRKYENIEIPSRNTSCALNRRHGANTSEYYVCCLFLSLGVFVFFLLRSVLYSSWPYFMCLLFLVAFFSFFSLFAVWNGQFNDLTLNKIGKQLLSFLNHSEWRNTIQFECSINWVKWKQQKDRKFITNRRRGEGDAPCHSLYSHIESRMRLP